MPMMFVRKIVDDFEAWNQRFEEQSDYRRANGALGARRFRSIENSNEIFVIIEWDTVERGAAFFGVKINGDPAFKDQMSPVFMEELEPLKA